MVRDVYLMEPLYQQNCDITHVCLGSILLARCVFMVEDKALKYLE